jgi:transposase-like protein
MKPKQSIPKELRYSVRDFDNEFPSDSACLAYVAEQRYPSGMAECAKCGKATKHHRVGNRTAYACQSCGNHIYPLAGTIFEKSTTSLKTWFYAMYLMGSTRCGISAKQIQRETGVTYKTAWRMFKQIRLLLSEGLQLEGSTVEMDEMFHGGHRRTSSWRDNKTPVVGMVERNDGKRIGRVVARVAPDVTKKTLHGFAKEYVLPKSTIFTDDYVSYDGLEMQGYAHKRIRHSQKVYVTGDVHTNTIEGFWSTVKRGIGGVYHNVSAKYLQTYLDEYCFRYNRRDQGNLLFKRILEQVSLKAS